MIPLPNPSSRHQGKKSRPLSRDEETRRRGDKETRRQKKRPSDVIENGKRDEAGIA
jgi:hypothetical protein